MATRFRPTYGSAPERCSASTPQLRPRLKVGTGGYARPQTNRPFWKAITPPGIPHEWGAELLEKGAPDGLVVEAAHELAHDLTLLEDPSSCLLVCFGTSGPYDRICLDPRTKQAVLIL